MRTRIGGVKEGKRDKRGLFAGDNLPTLSRYSSGDYRTEMSNKEGLILGLCEEYL